MCAIANSASNIKYQLTNSAVGVGVLALPFVFQNCGVLLALITLTACCYLTSKSCQLILLSCQRRNAQNYEACAKLSFGAAGKLLVQIVNACFLFGTLVAFQNVTANLALKLFLHQQVPVPWDTTYRPFCLVAFATCVFLPLSHFSTVRVLGKLTIVALCSYAVLLAHLFSTALPKMLSVQDLKMLPLWRAEGVLFALPIFSSALLLQPQLSVVVEDLSRHKSTLSKATSDACVYCFFFYSAVAVFGLLSYQGNVRGDILLSLGTDMRCWLVRFSFLLSLAVSYPLMLYPCRSSIFGLLDILSHSGKEVLPLGPKGAHQSKEVVWFIVTVMLVYLSAICAVLSPNVEFIIAISGSVSGSTLGYTLPGLLGLSSVDFNKRSVRLEAWLCTIFGLAIMFLSTWAVLNSSSNANENVVGSMVTETVYSVLSHTATIQPTLTKSALNLSEATTLSPTEVVL